MLNKVKLLKEISRERIGTVPRTRIVLNKKKKPSRYPHKVEDD